MTSFSEMFAFDSTIVILTIVSAPILIGLAALAIVAGRRTDAALDAMSGTPRHRTGTSAHPGNLWHRHPMHTVIERDRHAIAHRPR
jgi:hypothetical protein